MSGSKGINNKILEGESLALKGLPGSLKPLFISVLQEKMNRPMLVVIPDRNQAELIADELASLIGEEKVAFYPEGEEDIESPVIVNPRRAGDQMRVIQNLLRQSLNVVVSTVKGIFQGFPRPEILKKDWIEISSDFRGDLHELVSRLIGFGYTRESMVERPGEISLRGGILDVYPFPGDKPYRMEFIGDEIESIRTFDVATQLSTGSGDALHLIPAPPAWTDRSESLFPYFSDDLLVFWEDPELLKNDLNIRHSDGCNRPLQSIDWETLFQRNQSIIYYSLSSPKDVIDFGGKNNRHPGNTAAEIRENLASLCDTYREVYLICDRAGQIGRVMDFLDLDEEPISALKIHVVPLGAGFDLPISGLAVYTENELFRRPPRRRRLKNIHLGVPIRELSELKRGDFIVHIDHGIGKYLGLEKITVKDNERECLSILYRDGDKLFVPMDKMERVQKYSGRDGIQPSLNKLGSSQWERIKAKTKQSIKKIAGELIALYSARSALPGYPFSQDTPWQKELEASFEYDETPDQAKAVDNVKRDMEKPYPMDRLVCGDVGYGKTEVAIRAAFKVVTEGKQVAILVPTTILAQQHNRTFQERLSRFPVNIEMLSRFRSRQEQKSIVEKLKKGSVDIVIGTHRLLSRDIGFKDLGLLIIDEEQRFGVRHKDRLKAFRKTVDVLALSATPIPRTLQFSLLGIRDMSLITTPPRDRLSIITEVMHFEEERVAEAIEREMARGGQIFFVHNRIHSIYAVARMIRRLVPGIRLAIAHGRMDEGDLERVMLEFTEGKYDCLVATMIIESGLDMPNVNTLIVHRADRLGLAQLYQLRGRVGRSEKRAYAYLLTPPFNLLTHEAVKRLRTIEEFTELGSGFQIAIRDLEIRGAGNLLGVQQSGYMDAVGFDLYKKLVNEAIHELKSEEAGSDTISQSNRECRIDMEISAFFPDSYVADESTRVNLYRRLSAMQQLSEVDEFRMELSDRFGQPPIEADNLIQVAQLRIAAQEKGVKQIVQKNQTITVFFNETWVDRFSNSELLSNRLRSMIDSSPIPIRFLQDKEFGLRVTTENQEPFDCIKKLLQSWG